MQELTTFAKEQGTPIAKLKEKVFEVQGPRVNERGFFYSLSEKQKADALFREFMDLGIGYLLGSFSGSMLLGDYEGVKPLRKDELMRNAFAGNCVAMSEALAQVFGMAGIQAEAKELRAEKAGEAFIVHAPHFVDKGVTGNIFKEGVLWLNRYLFTNHTATWVPSLNTYYDLMAGTTYQSLAQHIEMELRATDGSGNVFEGTYLARTWRLVRRTDIKGPGGGFFRFDMDPKVG